MKLKPALFLHIQKTAGTSVVEAARRFYGENNFISHLDYHGHRPHEFKEKGFVSGHFGYEYARELMNTRYSFTFLRNPVERVLSFYYFCRRSNPDEYPVYRLAQEKTIDAFLDMALDDPQVKGCVWNHQTWQLACGWGNLPKKSIIDYDEENMMNEARAHLSEFDFIGFTETFDEDMMIILNTLGVKASVQIPRINKGGERPRLEDLPLSTCQRLWRITEMDRALFDYGRTVRFGRERV